MKSDWFNVLNGFINVQFDENLAYELEIFFKDYIFLKKQNGHIILKCLKNGKDYELKKAGNSLILKYDYVADKVHYVVEGRLDIYNRHYEELMDYVTFTNSASTFYKSNIVIKHFYKTYPLIEVIKRRAFCTLDVNSKYRIMPNDSVSLSGKIYDLIGYHNYDKTLIRPDIKTKHIVPDIMVGAECRRDENDTIIRTNKIVQGFPFQSDFEFTDDSLPIMLLSDEAALDCFMKENKQIEVEDYMKVKKRKIGF